jgi:hypothetical protein
MDMPVRWCTAMKRGTGGCERQYYAQHDRSRNSLCGMNAESRVIGNIMLEEEEKEEV